MYFTEGPQADGCTSRSHEQEDGLAPQDLPAPLSFVTSSSTCRANRRLRRAERSKPRATRRSQSHNPKAATPEARTPWQALVSVPDAW